jgi:hypothetical protein
MTGANGRVSDARGYVARAIRRARVRDTLGEAMAYRAMASLPWRGRGTTPEDYLALAMRTARSSPREQAVTLLHQAQHAASAGRRLEAHQLLDRARTQFAAMGMSWHDAAARRCSTELGLAHSP